MITTEEIKKMSRVDKIRLMEDLWKDLNNDGDVESPKWHEDELRKTEGLIAEGKEKKIDWNIAKRELQERCQ